MEQQRAVVVGYGAIGPVHAEAALKSEYAELHGICDTESEKRRLAEEQYSVKTYACLEEVLMDAAVDAVHICTPHYLHLPMLKQAVSAGKAVVVEKPVVLNREEITDLREFCKAYPKAQVCSILQNRLNPCVAEMKRIILSGDYGKVVTAKGFLHWLRDASYYGSGEWRGKRVTEGGGVVINQSLHLLDMLEYLCGRCVSVKGTTDNRTLEGVIEVEDTAEAMLTTEEGCRLFYYATNGYGTSCPYELEVQLEKAALKYTYNRLYLADDKGLTYLAEDSQKRPGKVCWGSSHAELINNFYASLSGENKPYFTLEEGLDAVRLADGLYRSAQSGNTEAI